ncbi:MAG: FG-GAP repeat domain-containing protein, partial [Planctomycetota bacterium]
GDFDGDGDVDVVMGSSRMYRNEGHGEFKDVSRASLPWQSVWVVSLAVGDVDGDRDLDLVLGARGTQNRLYLNDGKGKFSDRTTLLPKDSDLTCSVSLGDMDRDGDLDLVLGNRGTQNKLYLNDGKGRFADVSFVTMPPDTDPTAEIDLADVDGDGDLDMVLANGANNPVLQSGQNKLYINQGLRFRDLTATNMPKAIDPTLGVAVADFDGDKDLDLFFGNGGPWRARGQQNRLYLNDGKGRFSDATSTLLPRDTDQTESIAVGDIDEDGDVDIVYGQYALLLLSGRPVTVLLNNGKGKLQDSTVARLGNAPLLHGPARVTLADLDRDGDPELLLQSWPLWNLHRHVWGDSLARLGHDYVLDFYAEPGYAKNPIAAVPWLSLAELKPGIPAPPFGLFRLNPALMVSVPPVVISWPGKATLRLPLPNVAALKGRTLFTQALFLHSSKPAGWRLSNVIADTVIR